MKSWLILSIIYFYGFQISYSQSGSLDPSFGSNGVVRTNIGATFTPEIIGKQVLLQSDGSTYFIFQQANLTFITKHLSNGALDLSYGQNGFSSPVEIAPRRAALQADGKIVVIGIKESGAATTLLRYNTNGSLDKTFSEDGKLTTDFVSNYYGDTNYLVEIQRDGKIMVVSEHREYFDNGNNYNTVYVLARLNPDGSLDKTFSEDGVQTTSELAIRSLAFQSDGKIVVVGTPVTNSGALAHFALARYNSDGSLDTTFSKTIKQATDFDIYQDIANSVVIQSNGKIVVAGYSDSDSSYFALARYNANGSRDSTFSEDGILRAAFDYTYNIATSVVIQKDNKILVAGYSGRYIPDHIFVLALARYNSDGSLDTTFSEDGKQTTNFSLEVNAFNVVYSLAVQSNGKIVVATPKAIGRYTSDGNLDNTFDEDGKLNINGMPGGQTFFTSAAVQKDGKLVAAGYTWNGSDTDYNDFALVRYHTDGSLDKTFSEDGKQTTNFGLDDQIHSISIQRDGKIVAVGHTWNGSQVEIALARYNSDGSLDPTFSEDGKQTTTFSQEINTSSRASSVTIQTDGKIVVAGSGTSVNGGNSNFVLVRYNPDGSLDKTFSEDGKQITDFGSRSDIASSIAVQGDGKIVVVGYTQTPKGNTDFALARYNTDGSLDTTFSENGKQTTDILSKHDFALSVAIQQDDKIIVGGHSNFKFVLARYNTNGSLDTTFNEDGKQTTEATGIALSIATQEDGKIVAGGLAFFDSNSDFALARYNSDGSLDHTFGEDGLQFTDVSGVHDHIQALAIHNNKLYAVGYSEFLGNIGVVARYLLNNNNEPSWNLRYGGSGIDRFTVVIRTSDGGYLSGGYSNSEVSGDKSQNSRGGADYWIVKTDENGVKQWDKRYGGSNHDYLNRIIPTQDGGYLLAGSSTSGKGGDKSEASRGDQDYWIVKITSTGLKEWDKTYGGIGFEDLRKVNQLYNGDYLLAGTSDSEVSGEKSQASQGGKDYWIVRVSSDGTKRWDKTFGGSGEENLESFTKTSMGGFVLAGSSTSSISGNKSQASRGGKDYWLVRINSRGSVLWDKRYGGAQDEELYSIGITPTGEYFVAGHSSSGQSGDKSQVSQGASDYWMLKLSATGGKLWDKSFGGSGVETLRSIIQVQGGYVLAGSSNSPVSGDKSQASQGGMDYWLVKTDAEGNKEYDQRFGGSGQEELRYIQRTADGGYLLGGRSDSDVSGDRTQPAHGLTDYWLVKVMPPAKIQAIRMVFQAEAVPAPVKESVFPNPFSAGVTFRLTLSQTQQVRIFIYSTTGQLVRQIQTAELATGMHHLSWDGKNSQGQDIATGLYVYQLYHNQQLSTGKLLKTFSSSR